MSNIWNLPQLASGQASKEVTANDQSDEIVNGIANILTKNFDTDADITLDDAVDPDENFYFCYRLTDTGVVLTVTRNLIYNGETDAAALAPKIMLIDNQTAQTITVKPTAGTGVNILTATVRLLYCDGTNIISV